MRMTGDQGGCGGSGWGTRGQGGGRAASIYVRDGSPDKRATWIMMTYAWDVPPKIQRSGWGWASFGHLLFLENCLKHMTGASHRDYCFEPHPDNGGSPDSFLAR